MRTNLRFNNPWVIGTQGLIMIIFGIAAIVYPEITLKTITRFFGLLLLISGVFLVVLTKSETKNLPIFWLYEGVINITIGLLFLFFPAFVANIFVVIIGVLTLIIGIRNILFLINIKANLLKLGIARNLILVVFGLLFLFVPFESAVAITNIVGIVAIFYGIVTLYILYKLSALKKEEDKIELQ
jgi:uncharacterized membrane protein HdeD (DUF308 family)